MFDLPKPFRAEIKGLKLVVKQSGPVVNRSIRFKLSLQLISEIAEGLGPNGKTAWLDVKSGVLHKAVMIIDGLRAKARLVGSASELILESIKGVKATIKGTDGPIDGDEGPVDPAVDVEWEAPFSDLGWVFMGRNTKGSVDVSLERQNPELPNVNVEVPADKRRGRPLVQAALRDLLETGAPSKVTLVGPGGETTEIHGLGNILPFGPTGGWAPPREDLDEAQLADTPEEAEAIRADRLLAEDDTDPEPGPKSATDNDDDSLAF